MNDLRWLRWSLNKTEKLFRVIGGLFVIFIKISHNFFPVKCMYVCVRVCVHMFRNLSQEDRENFEENEAIFTKCANLVELWNCINFEVYLCFLWWTFFFRRWIENYHRIYIAKYINNVSEILLLKRYYWKKKHSEFSSIFFFSREVFSLETFHGRLINLTIKFKKRSLAIFIDKSNKKSQQQHQQKY